MAEIRCFTACSTGRMKRYLRRYRSTTDCPTHGYHEAMAELDEIAVVRLKDESGYEYITGGDCPHEDPRWPKVCDCGIYQFQEEDPWQVFPEEVYTAEGCGEFLLRDAPVGAMWDVPWFADHWHGPDGRCLCVKTPGGEWVIDGPSKDGRFWSRTGEPPNVTVTPSILIEGRYHGFLTNGVLREV